MKSVTNWFNRTRRRRIRRKQHTTPKETREINSILCKCSRESTIKDKFSTWKRIHGTNKKSNHYLKRKEETGNFPQRIFACVEYLRGIYDDSKWGDKTHQRIHPYTINTTSNKANKRLSFGFIAALLNISYEFSWSFVVNVVVCRTA